MIFQCQFQEDSRGEEADEYSSHNVDFAMYLYISLNHSIGKFKDQAGKVGDVKGISSIKSIIDNLMTNQFISGYATKQQPYC